MRGEDRDGYPKGDGERLCRLKEYTADKTDRRRAERDDGVDGVADRETSDKILHRTDSRAEDRAEHYTYENYGEVFKAEAHKVCDVECEKFAEYYSYRRKG